ncbi:conserved hypothetical protein [Mesorhizobium plurifarium]|uniref:Uncharacterized protein n=1 Tax=Mesorhizobium plurifarium TaxID=69974 RepID=A0A090F702_MESPL|nr:conserved hypothetical protein [Mesorhizobium plurifarium]
MWRTSRDPFFRLLKAEPALAGKAPVDAAFAASDAADVLAEMAFERWRPGNELEAEAVVDHGETTGGERQALAIRAGNMVAAGGTVEDLSAVGRVLVADHLQLATAQRIEQVAGELDAIALPLCEPLIDKISGAAIQGMADVGAEARFGKFRGRAGDGLAIKPGRTRRRDLLIDSEIGANRERNATSATRIVEFAQLDNRSDRAVGGCIKAGEPDVVGAPIHAIDNGIGSAIQLIVEPAIDEPADDGRIEIFGSQNITARATLDVLRGQRAMHALDDVTALAELAQSGFGLVVDDPLAWTDLTGETKNLKLAQATDLQRVIFIGLGMRPRSQIDDTGTAAVAKQLAIELCPTFGLDLAFERSPDVKISARSQLLRDQVASAVADSFLDVVARDDQVLAVLAHAANDEVNMGMLRVPVVDRHPVEPCAKVLFHLQGKVSGERSQIRHVEGIVRRDDEPEMVPVFRRARGEGRAIGISAVRPEQPRLFAVAGDTLSTQIIEMRRKRGAARGMTHDTRFDDGAARSRADQAIGLDAGPLPVAKARTVAGRHLPRARDATAGFLGRGQRLGDEGSGLLRTDRADTARSDAKLALIGHGIDLKCGKDRAGSDA